MQTLSDIRALLAERGLTPRKRFGQHFLHDKNLLAKLVDAAALAPGEVVLEVGPGTGTLTEALLEAGAEVVACEIDRDLAAIIEDRLGDRVTLVRGDCLQSRAVAPAVLDALGGRPFKLVANLPYQAASPLMCALLVDGHDCRGQYVTIQREVADRLFAEPGTKAYGPLTIIVRARAAVSRIATLGPGCFWPAPEVDSAMVAITPGPPLDDAAGFARFVTGVFSKRRKQLGSIFGRDRAWPEGVSAEQRPEALTVAQLLELYTAGP